jgi:hypothetical protein
VIKRLEMGRLWGPLSEWAPCNENRGHSDTIADFENGGMGHRPRNAGGLQNPRKVKELDCSLKPPEGILSTPWL